MRVVFHKISKRFGPIRAVDDVSLTIEEGEFFTLLGPSGCGKTTLLRLVAGFYEPDAGEIRFGDRRVNEVPPHKRETGMVFQNYALFPHLSVFENVAYGLKARKVPQAEIRRRIGAILEGVQLAGLEDRAPSQLSGGQQQRVALARALVISPQILLMDEPLSNLDARLRVSMREEIRRIQKDLGITTIYVTHDQEEAMAVSDRVAILNKGRVEQSGTPPEIYYRPRSRFAAEFMGGNNILEFTVTGRDEKGTGLLAQAHGQSVRVKTDKDRKPGQKITLALRPEWIVLDDGADPAAENCLLGTVVGSSFLGSIARYRVSTLGEQVLTIEVHDPEKTGLRKSGDTVRFRFGADRPVLLEV
jgi:iron(III) transport system ATP-binding protein